MRSNNGGVEWPETRTTGTAKSIWSAAAGASNPGTANEIAEERNWRYQYVQHVLGVAELQMASPESALSIARAGLAAANDAFRFRRAEADGEGGETDVALSELQPAVESGFETVTIRGDAGIAAEVKSGAIGNVTEFSQRYVSYGAAEPSFATSCAEGFAVAGDDARRRELFDGTVFVLLGATSAGGPCRALLELGATVAGICRPGSKCQDLIRFAEGTPGVLLLPQGTSGDGPGADLMQLLPELIAWVRGVEPTKRLVVGSYIYLDSEAHVRATMAMDKLVTSVIAERPDTALAYLGSPTTAYPVPTECHLAMETAYDGCSTLRRMNPFRLLQWQRNARPLTANGFAIHDGLSVVQGPNYALAKTLQHWRAIVARADGALVSARMAPPMRTASMLSSPTVAAALKGMEYFPPYVVLDPPQAATAMLAVLLYDLTSPESNARPTAELGNPMELFQESAFHGGSWRCAYNGNSIGTAMFLAGKVSGIF